MSVSDSDLDPRNPAVPTLFWVPVDARDIPAGTNLSPQETEWLLHGEHGLSSMAIFHVLVLGAKPSPERRHPWDIDDFRRCERLLRAVPDLRSRMALMATCSPIWARLITWWDVIVTACEIEIPGLFEPDAPPGGRAPIAWAIMERVVFPERAL